MRSFNRPSYDSSASLGPTGRAAAALAFGAIALLFGLAQWIGIPNTPTYILQQRGVHPPAHLAGECSPTTYLCPVRFNWQGRAYSEPARIDGLPRDWPPANSSIDVVIDPQDPTTIATAMWLSDQTKLDPSGSLPAVIFGVVLLVFGAVQARFALRDSPELRQVQSQVLAEKRDPSLWLLLAANAVTVGIAAALGWNQPFALVVYCVQTLFVGLLGEVRLIHERKIAAALFFPIHWGLFAAIFVMFALFIAFPHGVAEQWGTIALIVAVSAIFAVSHIVSYMRISGGSGARHSTTLLMGLPYLRFVPMFFTLVPNAGQGPALAFFLVMKTLTDVGMHVVETVALSSRQGWSPGH